MEGVTQSMAGRVGIIEMSPLSMSEILGREEKPFVVDFEKNIRRAMEKEIPVEEVYRMIVRGGYPELHGTPEIGTSEFYSDYVDTYIEKDVSLIINLKDELKFRQFMEYLASITGQELVYDNISNALGVSIPTIQSWLGVLVTGGIVHLLQPYSEGSNVKRAIKRPKIYFCDTGLACYLARVCDPDTLQVGYLNGPMVETFIVNEIMKSYSNNTEEAGFHYYRDSSKNEIDLVIEENGTLYPLEMKKHADPQKKDMDAFDLLDKIPGTKRGPGGVICLYDRLITLKGNDRVIPINYL